MRDCIDMYVRWHKTFGFNLQIIFFIEIGDKETLSLFKKRKIYVT